MRVSLLHCNRQMCFSVRALWWHPKPLGTVREQLRCSIAKYGMAASLCFNL